MTLVRARWFPASVKFPSQPVAWGRTFVLVADDGLHVFRRPREVADFHAAIDWDRTTIPSDRQARNGVDVWLADGRLVVVTAGNGCKCGQLGKWAGPAWAVKEGLRR